MAKAIYTAHARVVGGRADGHGVTTDGALDVHLRRPPEMGGEGGGTNPEQLFAVGYAACFEGAVGAVARRRRIELADVSVESHVSLNSTAERGYAIGAALDVTLPSVEDPAEAVEIVRDAHAVCPYSNAVRGNVDVRLTANGQAVET